MSKTYHVYVSDRGNVFMTEIAALLAAALSDLGREVVFPAQGLPEAGPGRVNLVVAPHEFFHLQQGVTDDDLLRAAEQSVMVGVEQPGTEWFEIGLKYSSVARAVLDISRVAVTELQRRGLGARHLQLGYHRSWDCWGGDPRVNRSTDLLFLGSVTPRRERALSAMAPFLWDCVSDIRLFEYPRPMTEPRANFVASTDKWRLLADSRILLNVHRIDVPYFEWVRALEAVVNGCLVLSEHSEESGALIPGQHFVAGPLETLGAYAASLMTDEPLRREITVAAYEFVRGSLDMCDILRSTLDEVEVEGPRSRTRRLSPAVPEIKPGFVGSPLIEDALASESRIRARVKELLDSETALIRQVEAMQSELRWGESDHEEVAESAGWAERPGRVSVIVTSFNTEALLTQAVSSVLDSSGVSVELIVVDDHSRDGSVEWVRGVMQERPEFPLCLVARAANGGVSVARNSGLARARGEYVFILDSDNEIFPNALEKLSEALDKSPEAALAYGIIAKSDGSGLYSNLPWDVPRLCVSNYVDAMALIRREVLDEVGYYDAHFGLRGWEDYELWLRVAATGGRGEFVPGFMGLYSVRNGSRQETVNLDNPALFREFKEIPVPSLEYRDVVNEPNAETDELLPDALVTAEVLNLRSELGRTRRTLQQREDALAILNRRLVALENGEPGSAGGPLGETARLTQQLMEANERLAQTTVDMERLDWAQAEVLRLQASKMFRYTWPVRRVISAMRMK